MTKHNKCKILPFLLASILAIAPIFSHAGQKDDPPIGNADATDEHVLVERKMILDKAFEPENLRIFREVEPVLKVANQLPEFGKALRMVLEKKWLFSHDGIEKCPTELTYYSDPYTKVACQYSDKVVINPDFFTKFKKSNEHMSKALQNAQLNQNQRDLVVFELILGPVLGKGINAVTLARVLEVLTKNPAPTADEIQRVLEASGYGVYATHEQYCSQTMVDRTGSSKIEQLSSSVAMAIEKINRYGYVLYNESHFLTPSAMKCYKQDLHGTPFGEPVEDSHCLSGYKLYNESHLETPSAMKCYQTGKNGVVYGSPVSEELCE